ncbi:hypothetical protein KGY71_06820, partial [Candidatus Bipolaricaulota bacterium]|nr:hypothetical protein [Candidatus Bipolaricaulota bacterium]
WIIQFNNIYGNEDGIQIEGTGHEVHYNSIHDNTFIGLTCDSQVDATLNWWGSSDGPWYDKDRDSVPEYDGGGEKIYGSTYFSPWLGINPDDDPNKVGVQLKSPMKFIVAKAGPEPPEGYLNTAISASNDQINFPGPDTIQVKEGTYNPSRPITDSTKLISESGPVSDFILNGDLSVKSPGVIIGGPDQGFTVNGDIIVGAGVSGSSLALHHNFISGLLTHNGSGTVDASVNYWGDNGPEDNLAGDKSSIIYSPWLGTLPGYSPTVYMVDDVGAEPEGSLQRAISDANTHADRDKIMVSDGDFTVSAEKPVTQSTEIVSTTGCPANACINGELTLEAEEILLGKREELTNTNKGFTIDADVTVASGVNASTVHISWNNIYGTVTNNGEGTLDAEYNWWGDPEGPTADDAEGSIEGDVDYEPYLPADVCSVLEYMDENDITNPEEAVAGMITDDLSSSEQAVAQLTTMGFDLDEAEELLNEFGLGRVFSAMDGARNSQEFIELLGGYSLPAGAAGGLTNNIVAGGAGSVGGQTVGAVFEICEPVKVSFPLADFEGNTATDLHPTVSLVSLNKKGNEENLEKVSTATYTEEEKAYVATFATCELEPGYYKVQIDLPVLSSLSQVIKLEEKGS